MHHRPESTQKDDRLEYSGPKHALRHVFLILGTAAALLPAVSAAAVGNPIRLKSTVRGYDVTAFLPSHMPKLPSLFARLLCRLGFHNFRVINKTFEFGMEGGVETVECRRCGVIMIRRA